MPTVLTLLYTQKNGALASAVYEVKILAKDYFAIRLRIAPPTRPSPNSNRVAGSGTAGAD